jgi:uncharacterized protein involved in exopolysaccharide biosynthesis
MPINDYQSTSSAQRADELSFLDVIDFIQESWKTIASLTLFGVAGAAIYLWVIPDQFEARAQIKMAQIASLNNNNNINPLGISIEEPQALIARMALPTSYSKETIALCGLSEQRDPEVVILSKVRLSIPNGVGGTVDLRIRDASKETAKACAIAVYQLIKSSQAQLVAPYIQEASKKLAIEQERLSRATQVIAKADKSGAAVSAAYLATRDEIRYLIDQISNLQNIITDNDARSAHLTAPVYMNSQPVFPQKRQSILNGLLFGGLAGLLLALVRRWLRSSGIG